MRRLMILAVAALFLSAPVAFAGSLSPGVALAPGDKVPAVTATDSEGKAVRLTWRGARLNLVNLWATWCKPCREEMPEIEKLNAHHAAQGLNTVGIVVLDRAPADAIQKAAADAGVNYRILAGTDDSVQVAFGGIAIVPTTFLLDGEGKVVRKYVGSSPAQTEILARDIDDFLAGRPLGAPYVPPLPEKPKK